MRQLCMFARNAYRGPAGGASRGVHGTDRTTRERVPRPAARLGGGDALPGYATGHQHTVATVWAVSAARVAREHPAASALLRLCALLGPQPIPVDLFIGNPSALPEPLRAVAGNELTFTETAGVLIGYSLVRRRPEGLIMHRLVQAVTRHDLDAATRIAAAEAAVEPPRADLPATGSSRPEEWPRWRLLLPHVLAAVSGWLWLAGRAPRPDPCPDGVYSQPRSGEPSLRLTG